MEGPKFNTSSCPKILSNIRNIRVLKRDQKTACLCFQGGECKRRGRSLAWLIYWVYCVYCGCVFLPNKRFLSSKKRINSLSRILLVQAGWTESLNNNSLPIARFISQQGTSQLCHHPVAIAVAPLTGRYQLGPALL